MGMQVACRACPRCGNREFHLVKPNTFVYFRKDRLCTRCPTYYSPPTPAWASLLFIILGALLALPAGAAFVAVVSAEHRDACGTVVAAILCTLGVLSFVQGMRYLFQKVVNP